MGYHEHKHLSVKNVRCAVLIISDSRTEKDDESGAYLKKRLLEEGHQVSFYSILKNDAGKVKDVVNELLAGETQVIITSGGTGLSHRDVTVDTIEKMLEKKDGG